MSIPPVMEPQVRVVLDTTAIVSDWMLESAPIRALLWAAGMYHVEIYVPEIVIQEAVTKWGERFDRAYAALDDLRLLGLEPAIQNTPTNGLEAREFYDKWLRQRLGGEEVYVPGFPNTSHQAVVTRALRRAKPFDDKGQRGYRDALIWHTLLETLEDSSTPEFALVTANYRDFATLASKDASDPLTLLPSLSQEAEEIAAGREIRVFRSVRGFVEHYVKPAAEIEDNLNQRLTNESMFRNALLHMVREAIEDKPDLIGPGFPDALGVQLQQVDYEGVLAIEEEIRCSDAWLLNEEEAVVSFGGWGQAQLRVQVKNDDAQSLLDAGGTLLKEGEVTSEIRVVVPVFISVDASYRPQTDVIENLQFGYLNAAA